MEHSSLKLNFHPWICIFLLVKFSNHVVWGLKDKRSIKFGLLIRINILQVDIRVFGRVRPPLDTEADRVLKTYNFPDEGSIEFKVPGL